MSVSQASVSQQNFFEQLQFSLTSADSLEFYFPLKVCSWTLCKSVLQVNVYEKSVCVISEIIGEITFIHMIKHPVHSYLYVLPYV